MATYAQIDDLKSYTELQAVLVLSDADMESLLERAELDLDQNLFPPVMALTVANRKIDLTDLNELELFALNRATCAQAEYRVVQGPAFFVQAQYKQVGGPGGFSTTGRLPIVGPKVKRELGGTGLMPIGAQSSPQRGRLIR
jgi:hypothetical protein